MIVVGRSERATDRMTLYEAWYAAAILVAMCVRIDRGGLFRNLGSCQVLQMPLVKLTRVMTLISTG